MSDRTTYPYTQTITPLGPAVRVDSGFDPTADPSSMTSSGSQSKYITISDNTKPPGYRAVPLSPEKYSRWRAGEIAISNSRTGDYTLGSESGSGKPLCDCRKTKCRPALHPPYLPADLDIVSFIPNYHRSMVRDKFDLHTRMELPNPAEQYSAQCTEPRAGNTQFCISVRYLSPWVG
mgnify:CR=1 FL=1